MASFRVLFNVIVGLYTIYNLLYVFITSNKETTFPSTLLTISKGTTKGTTFPSSLLTISKGTTKGTTFPSTLLTISKGTTKGTTFTSSLLIIPNNIPENVTVPIIIPVVQTENSTISTSTSFLRRVEGNVVPLVVPLVVPFITIIVLGDNLNRYSQQIIALTCYCNRHNYRLVLFQDAIGHEHSITCSNRKWFFFRKHCIVAQILKNNTNLQSLDKVNNDWYVILDADVLVVNTDTKIESFLPSSLDIHVIHYERFHNGEIAAGNYIVRNHPWTITYLETWSSYEEKAFPGTFSNADNGALHLHILSTVIDFNESVFLNQKNTTKYDICLNKWQRSHSLQDYDKFVGCCKCALGGQRFFPEQHIWIIRRGMGWVRDFFVSAPFDPNPDDITGLISSRDLMFHGVKDDLTRWYTRELQCVELECPKGAMKGTTNGTTFPSTLLNNNSTININDTYRYEIWQPPINPNMTISIDKMISIIRYRDEEVKQKRPHSVLLSDIGYCWPKCPLDYTRSQTVELINHRECATRPNYFLSQGNYVPLKPPQKQT